MPAKIKNVFFVTTMLMLAGLGYVLIVNSNAPTMTFRQKLMKAIYPAIVWMNKLSNKNMDNLSHAAVVPPVPFYSLKTVLNDGSTLDMASLKGKKVLLVNTASACGYTPQYEQLQKLYSQYSPKLVVIGFPANDFKEQEKGTDAEIASFCKVNFGVRFPLAQKSVVIKTHGQNSIFQWLTSPAANGWNSEPPSWNFCKYLINENGVLLHYFGPGVEPMSAEIIQAVQQ